tara:strand:- start:701 stop:814 length:114 start_codon:yes stop_codon:yes gene_type:complete
MPTNINVITVMIYVLSLEKLMVSLKFMDYELTSIYGE